jgi:hypothetical protein
MLDNFGHGGAITPDTFTVVTTQTNGAGGNPAWQSARTSYMGVPGTPTAWFDGARQEVGAGSTSSAYAAYLGHYNARRATATDVVINLSGAQLSGQTYQITAQICIDAGGAGKTMRIYMVQVLDDWPNYPVHTPRYGFVQAATVHGSEDLVTVAAGGCGTVTRNFTFTGDSWTNQTKIKMVVWAAPQSTGSKVVYQAATLHWPFEPPKIPGDLNGDLLVDLNDIPAWALAMTNPTQFHIDYPDVDLDVVGDTNEDGSVDGRDTYTFVNLLINDHTGPTPSPMSWAPGGAPAALSTSSITMTATEASDPAGVEYYFTVTGNNGHSSGWQSSRTYTDSGMDVNRNYNVTVKARDLSPQHNEGTPSSAALVATMIETPTNLVTGTVTSSSIQVTAQPVFTRLSGGNSGVWYEVTDQSGTVVGGAQANAWVKLQTITASGLTPNTTYRFRVRARNYYGLNITPWYPESSYIEITTAAK